MDAPEITIPTFVATHEVTGQTFEIPQDLLHDLNREYRAGFANGFSRGFIGTVGIFTVTVAVGIGVSLGTVEFLKWRERRKDIGKTSDDSTTE
jgi:hypothetical protein